MVFVYTGVFSEHIIIIHYNSVKKIHGTNFLKYWYRRFADGNSPMFQLALMLPMFDVYIGRTLTLCMTSPSVCLRIIIYAVMTMNISYLSAAI